MSEQVLFPLLSAIVGAFVGALLGALFSVIIPHFLYDPRIKILDIDYHHSYHSYNLIVVNKGKTAAINAVGRITIRPIVQGSVRMNRDGSNGTKRKSSKVNQVSYESQQNEDAWLGEDDWRVGIETEHIHWATYPRPTRLNVNPNVAERLVIAFSDGPWVDITSETATKKRARLNLASGETYYGEIVIAAENCQSSKPFRFKISLGQGRKAVLERYKGLLPERA